MVPRKEAAEGMSSRVLIANTSASGTEDSRETGPDDSGKSEEV